MHCMFQPFNLLIYTYFRPAGTYPSSPPFSLQFVMYGHVHSFSSLCGHENRCLLFFPRPLGYISIYLFIIPFPFPDTHTVALYLYIYLCVLMFLGQNSAVFFPPPLTSSSPPSSPSITHARFLCSRSSLYVLCMASPCSLRSPHNTS